MRAWYVAFSSTAFAAAIAGCAAIAGVGDYRVDDCIDGCAASEAGGQDGTTPDSGSDTSTSDTSTDAPSEGGPSPGLSVVTLPGTGVPVGKLIVARLTAKNETGDPVPRTGAKVAFTSSGGTSVVTIGPVTDNGDGTYVATITGVTEGTKLAISATIDGAPLKTAPASLRVVDVVTTGLTASLDAENADNAGNAGGKGCPAAGLAVWTDTSTNGFTGALAGFADVCAGPTGSGWAGSGTVADPYRLVFDGVDDIVNFGAVNSIIKQTVLAWVRKKGAGTPGITGTGGFGAGALPSVYPVVSKGAAEAENDAVDINFHLAITTDGRVGSDYEQSGTSANAPFMSTGIVADNVWTMIGFTFDATGTRAIWIDGKSNATTPPGAAPSTGSSSLFVIGGSQLSNNTPGSPSRGRFKGDVAVVLTYDRALTQSEIEANCHALSARFGMLSCPN
jgi:hypothetical protein